MDEFTDAATREEAIMGKAETAPEDLSPGEEFADVREKIVRIVSDAIIVGDDGPFLDLELFTRMLLHRAIPYRDLNRVLLFSELQVVRDEQHVQQVKAENERLEPNLRDEADNRLHVLQTRERQILDQLWPLP
jgi:hypothetical protein